MRVLQIGMSSGYGGVESFVMNYARYLKHEGILFDYIDLYGKGLAHSRQMIEDGSVIYTIKDHRRHPFLALKAIQKIIEEGGYSCVHINMLSAASPVAVLASLRTKVRVIVHSHNTKTIGIHRKILHLINSFYLDRLPLIRLACSENAGKWMFRTKKYEVVPNAIYPEKFRYNVETRRSLRNALGIGENEILFGFVGRLFAQKNPVYLAQILNAVKKRLSQNAKLLIVGDGILQEDVFAAATELGVVQDIVCIGQQANVADWYSAMDAFLLPSLWEGLPLVGIEAQSAGLPCFMSNTITEELVLTDLVHFCQLQEDAENWAEEIVRSINQPTDRGKYAEEIAQSKFSVVNSADFLRRLYYESENISGGSSNDGTPKGNV